MIINKYRFEYNDDGYIIGFYSVDSDEYDYEGQMANFPFATRGWTKLVDGQLVDDLTKRTEILQKEADEQEISELQTKLNETDYIFAKELEEITALSNPITFVTDLIKILVSYAKEYKEVIANRKTWRERIKELKGE